MSSATNRPVRTRFAPSPTGPLHIGGVKSAMFGWLLARHHGGQFILRLEDTDQKRYKEGSEELIYEALDWLGITPDEGPREGGPYAPYVQSDRLEHYQTWANWLVENGKAYKCFCTSERLQQVNEEKVKRKESPGYDRFCANLTAEEVVQKEAEGLPYVIRFKMPEDGVTVGHDLIRGEVTFENAQLQDAVLLKSDGFPTYHLAHVVDDHMMEITHTTRANEWLPSFPLHVQIWNALGWEMPLHAHLPVLLNPNGKGKMSKRSTSFDSDGQRVLVLAREYKDAGYEPEAVFNFLANIGWNFGDDREIFSVEEAVERFEITAVSAANSAFPIEKLDWMNGIYIREMADDELARRLARVLTAAGYEVDHEIALKVAPIVKERLKKLNEVTEMAGFFFADWATFEAPPTDMLIQKKMDAESTASALEAAYNVLENLEDFSHASQYEAMKDLAQELGLKNSPLFGALRVAVTAQRVSPPTFETIEILGKQESLRRIRMAMQSLAK